MTVKEKIIRDSISVLEKEISEIDLILNGNPLSDICRLRIEIQELLKTETDNNIIMEALKKASAKEKKLFALAEKQRDTCALITKKVELDFELSECKNELYWIEVRNRKEIP